MRRIVIALALCGCASAGERDGEAVKSGGDAGVDSGDAGSECDPREASSLPSGPGSGSGTSDGKLDGSANFPGMRTPCTMYAGEGAPPEPACSGAVICCELKDECFDPETEPDFCARPYCKD